MSTKWGAEDYEKAAELCERTGSLHDNDGAYADMLRHASAALTAAAERETACAPYLKDGETPAECIERHRKDIDATLELLKSEKSQKEYLRQAVGESAEREQGLREEIERLKRLPERCQSCDDDELYEWSKRAREAEATVAMQQSCLDAACSERDDLEAALAAERQKVQALRECIQHNARDAKIILRWFDEHGLTPDPPRAEP